MAVGLKSTIVVLLVTILASMLHSSMCAVYKVGDSAGWTTIGKVDYKAWAGTKTFQVGDIIVFQYNPQFHNVMQVTHPEYQSCNASSPIATRTTGNDSIPITKHGHHFFICGVPGHCQAGQKVDINVLRAPSTAPVPSSEPPLIAASAAPAPSPTAASSSHASTKLSGKPMTDMAIVLAFAYACAFA